MTRYLKFSSILILVITGCSNNLSSSLPIAINQLSTYQVSVVKEGTNIRPSYVELKKDDSLFVANVFPKRSPEDYSVQEQTVETNLYSLYHKLTTPYPGFISNKSGCNKEFHPIKFLKKTDNEFISLYYTFANKHYSMGICDDQSIAFRAIQGTAYCKATSEYMTFRWFYKLNEKLDIKKLLTSIKCKN